MVALPLDTLATYAERQHWQVRIHDFLTFGPEHQVGVFPSGRVDLGSQASAGIYFFWNDIWGESDLRVRATSGGRRVWTTDGSWTWRTDSGALALAVHASQRPDGSFHGLGPDSSPEAKRLGERHLQVRLRHQRVLSNRFSMTAQLGHEWWSFDADPEEEHAASVAEAIAAGRFEPPPALDGGVLALFAGFLLEYDTRDGRLLTHPREASDYDHVSGSGFSIRPHALVHLGVRRTRAAPAIPAQLPAWLDYGVTTSGTLDLTGTQRRLELELHGALADPLPGAGPVPFSHLAALGGNHPLRGFGRRRLLDRSAAAATLRYRWPISTQMDGSLHAATGNVFGSHFEGFAPERLRASLGIGVATATASDHPFEVLVAFGTETFQAGGRIESLRLTAGTAANF